MSTHNDTARFKAVVLACRCCGNRRRYIVTEDEAGYIEAQFIDAERVLVFNAYDLSDAKAEDGGRFSQTILTSDLSGIQTFPLSPEEIKAMRPQEKILARPGGLAVTPVAALAKAKGIPAPVKTGLSTMLGGMKK